MRTRTSLLIGASIALAGASVPALAADETSGAAGAALPVMGKAYSGDRVTRSAVRPGQNGGHRWGPHQNGRWYAGWRAPGGWNAYRRPAYGYILPRYWTQPSYYISDYSTYGLPAPATGYGWSRYYDDAVMTDRDGRVYDTRSNLDWNRYDGGYAEDRGYRGRRDSGVGGAAIGAVVGGVAGNRIAGRGNRTAGTFIGAGVGAVAGAVIDGAEDGPRRGPPPRHDGYSYASGPDYAYADDGVTYGGAYSGDYQGRWVGTWHGSDGTTYSGEYEGDYRGTTRGVTYDTPTYEDRPHWSDHGAPALPPGGYVANGWYYPAPTVTTVVVQPAMQTTTTTTYVTETVRVARPTVRRKVVRRCNCK